MRESIRDSVEDGRRSSLFRSKNWNTNGMKDVALMVQRTQVSKSDGKEERIDQDNECKKVYEGETERRQRM